LLRGEVWSEAHEEMRRAALLISCMLLGGGLGLALGEWLSGIPLQAVLVSTLAFGTLLLRVPRAMWATPLTLSLIFSLSLLSVRTASTLLYLLVTDQRAAPPLLTMLGVPESFYADSMLILLGTVYILLLGAALLEEGLITVLSPLWEGLEALPTPSRAAFRLRARGLVAGLPLGAIAALLDSIYNGYAAFTLLIAGSSSIAALTTLAVNLPLVYALETAFGASARSIALGVQAGALISTALMAALLYAKHVARGYPHAKPNTTAVLVGLLALLLGFTALLGPASAASAAVVAVVTIIVTSLAVVRLEGELYILALIPSARPPGLLWAAWWGAAILTGLDARLIAALTNPSCIMLLALAALWSYKLSGIGARPTPLLTLALALPILLTLARGATDPERWRPSNYMYLDSVKELASPPQLPAIDPFLMTLTACIVAVICLLTYYLAPPDSGLRLAAIVASPGGLLMAYSGLVPPNPALWIMLAILAVLRYVELRLHSDACRQVLYGGLSTYGVLLATLTALGIS